MLLNCGVGEDSWESLGLQGDPTRILKEISPEYSLEGLILKLKLQYFGHLKRRTQSLEKTLLLEKIEGRRIRGWQRMRWLDGATNLMYMSLNKLRGLVMEQKGLACCSQWGRRVRHNWATELNWSVKKEFVCRLHCYHEPPQRMYRRKKVQAFDVVEKL